MPSCFFYNAVFCHCDFVLETETLSIKSAHKNSTKNGKEKNSFVFVAIVEFNRINFFYVDLVSSRSYVYTL